MDSMTKAQRSRIMSKIRSKDTKAEILLRKTLWHLGFRYRKNWRKLPGTPDIALTRQKIAIFVDGDFWHARVYRKRPGDQIASRKKYWQKKLARNVERDKEVNDALTQEGWLVLRFWESDVQKKLEECVENVLSYASPRRSPKTQKAQKTST
ncbi:MAG: very short patch repair endonuclease [Schwartzia sp.]|nr:very short patch repair endonuclease [Schwartzia sp. (in: firmicutes)]